MPTYFIRAILRNESGYNGGTPMAKELNNFGGLKYASWMAEYGVTEFRDETMPSDKPGLAKFPDDETFVKVWTELYMGPQAYSEYQEAAALAAQGKFREAAEKHAFMYVAGGNPEQWQANHPNDSYEQIVSNIEQILREEYERNDEFGENGLTYQYIPASNTAANDIVAEARKYVGKSYTWGGEGPNEFDCSGLVQYVFNKFGVQLMHDAEEQKQYAAKYGTKVDMNQLQPGDLLFFTHKGENEVHHTGIYSGDGKMIDAANSELGVIEDVIGHENDTIEAYRLPVTNNAPATVAGAFMIINPDGTIVTNVDTDTDIDADENENAAFINPKETNKLKTNIDKVEEEIPTIVLGVYQENNNIQENNDNDNNNETSISNVLRLNNTLNNIIMNLLQQDIPINPHILSSLKSYQPQPQSPSQQKSSNNLFIPNQSFILNQSFIPNQPQENIFTSPNKSIDNIYTVLNDLNQLFNINEQISKIIAEQSIEAENNETNKTNETDINEINNNIINSLLLTNNYTIFDLLRNYIFLSQNTSEHYLEKDINTIYNTIINQYNNEDIEEDEDIYQDIIEYINTQDKINMNVYLPDILKFINHSYINDILNTTFLQDLTINQPGTKNLSNLIKALSNINDSIIKNFIAKNSTIKDFIPSEIIEKINTDNILEANEINKNKIITDIPQTDKFSPRREKLNRDATRKKYKNKLLQLMTDEINKQQHIKKFNKTNKAQAQAQAKKIKQLSNLEQLLNIFTLFDNDNLLNTIIPSENKITNVLGAQFILPTENKRLDNISELFNIESILNLSQNIELIPNLLSNAIEFISQIFNNKYNQTNRKYKITEDTNIYNTNTIEEENISTDEKITILNITDINAIDTNTINNNIINNNLSSNIFKLLLSPSLTYMPQILQLIHSSFFNQQIINKPQAKPLTSILRSIFKNIFIPSRSNIIQQSIIQFTDILNTYINELINDQTINELISEIDDSNDDDNIDNISRVTKLLNQQLIKSIINLINTDKFVSINEFIPTSIYNTNNIEKTSAQIKKSDTNISIVNKLLNAIKNDSQIINTADKLINTIKKKDIKNIFNKSISSTDILEQINTLIQYINDNNITDNQSLRNNLFRELFKEDTSELPINSNTTNLFNIFNLLSSIDIKNIFEQKHQNVINEPSEKNEVINNFLVQFINMLHEYDNIINTNYDLYTSDKDTFYEEMSDEDIFDEDTSDKNIFDEELPTAVLGVSEYINDEAELPTAVLGVKYINDEAENVNNIIPNLYPTQTTDAFLDAENILNKEEFINANILPQFTNNATTDIPITGIPSNNIPTTDIFSNKSSLYDFNYTNNFYNNFNKNIHKNINANISMNPILDINKIINNNFTNNFVNNISGIDNSILVKNKSTPAKNTNTISDNFILSDIKSKDNIQAKNSQNINTNTDTDILSNTPLNKAKSQIKSEFNNSAVLSSSMNLDNNKQISSIRTLESQLESQQDELLSAMSKHTDTLHTELKQLNDEYVSNIIIHNIEEKSRINNITNTYNKNIEAIQRNSIERIKTLTKKMQEAIKDFVDDYTATHPSASKAELEQVQQQFIYRNVNIPVTITTVNDDLLSKIKQLCKDQFAEYEDIQEQLALILKDYYDTRKVRQVLDEYRNRIRRPQENIEAPTDTNPPENSDKPDQYIS